MVIVTIVWVRVFIAPIVLQQFLQVGKWRVVAFLAVPAVLDVQVLSAFDTQTLAVGIMQRTDRDLEQRILPDQWSQVNLSVIRDQQP
jgi:hypothetical protein